MKVALFSTHVMWSPHFETELEIMQRHLDESDGVHNEIHEFACDQSLLACNVLIDRRVKAKEFDLAAAKKSICPQCIRTRKKGLSLINGRYDERQIVSNAPPAPRFRYESLDELRQIKVKNCSLGQAVASVLVNSIRDARIDVSKLQPIIDDCLSSSFQLYHAAKEYLVRERYDRAYIFNGRFAHAAHALKRGEPLKWDDVR
jgi:hypothetical protein